MKVIYHICCYFLIVWNVSAQNGESSSYKIESGAPFKTLPYNNATFVHGDFLIGLKASMKEFRVEKIDKKSLNLISQKTYKTKKIFPNREFCQDFILEGDVMYGFYSPWKSKNDYLYVKKLNINSGEFFNEKNIQLVDLKGEAIGFNKTLSYQNNQTKFRVYSNKGDNNELVYHVVYSTEATKKRRTIHVSSFNAQFKSIGSFKFELPYELRNHAIEKIFLGADKNIKAIVSYKGANYAKNKFGKKYNLSYDLLSLDIKANQGKITKLNLGETFGLELGVIGSAGNLNILTTEESILFLGLNKNKEKNHIAENVFFARFDINGTLIAKNNSNFSKEILTKYESDKTLKRLKKNKSNGIQGYPDLHITDAELLEGNEVILIGEEIRYSQGSSGISYFSESIIVIKLDANGITKFVKKIPRYLTSKESLLLYKNDSDILLFYYAHDNNLTLPADEEAIYSSKNSEQNNLILTTINRETGFLKSEVIIDYSIKVNKKKFGAIESDFYGNLNMSVVPIIQYKTAKGMNFFIKVVKK